MDFGVILRKFNYDASGAIIEQISEGLINCTWKVSLGDRSFILQEINTNVFKEPHALAWNIDHLSEYLAKHHPTYLFPSPISGDNKEKLIQHDGRYYRMFDYIRGSHTIDTVRSPDEAYEAARQFGKFTALLSGFPAEKLRITIPEFHNLSLRFQQFEESLLHGNQERIGQAMETVDEVMQNRELIAIYEEIRKDENFPRRVIHHDTKISNVLFDAHRKGLCVIDLDTVMPGYFISDLGDMIRTYVSEANEEEQDITKINIRMRVIDSVLTGYLEKMGPLLTEKEREAIEYAGPFMTYMQALRFLTDHFNDDRYYGAGYNGHNFFRARNQLQLLQLLKENATTIKDIVQRALA